jgi:uncharacterized membrane-anchored protein YhcB (DUF1043 family)
MPAPTLDDLSKTAKDALYVTVGLGVIAFQKAQVRRQELSKQLDEQRKQFETQAAEAREQFAKLIEGLEQQFQPVVDELESRLDEIENRLPEQAKTFVHQALENSKAARTEVRNRLVNAA